MLLIMHFSWSRRSVLATMSPLNSAETIKRQYSCLFTERTKYNFFDLRYSEGTTYMSNPIHISSISYNSRMLVNPLLIRFYPHCRKHLDQTLSSRVHLMALGQQASLSLLTTNRATLHLKSPLVVKYWERKLLVVQVSLLCGWSLYTATDNCWSEMISCTMAIYLATP